MIIPAYDLSKKPEYIYLPFSKRPDFSNKVVRAMYFVSKIFHAGIWFYFVPFSVLFLSYKVPEAVGPYVCPLAAD